MKKPVTKAGKRILVIRNDKIGDFMLAWPSFALLKKQYPDAEITALVPEYTAELAELCEWIDHILIDHREKSFIKDIMRLRRNIRHGNFDVSISLFSQARTAIALWLAGVKCRIGPATKIAQIFLNRRLRQRRSLSEKPEFEYNIDLVRFFIQLHNDIPETVPPPPYLSFSKQELARAERWIHEHYDIQNNDKLIIIHPGTGGSAINLDEEQYAELAHIISRSRNTFILITAGPGELQYASSLSAKLDNIRHGIYESTDGITRFCLIIATADLFISGSTGPLHIAGALDTKTIGFYPQKRSATRLRWQTLNKPANHLYFCENDKNEIGEENIYHINLSDCADRIQSFILQD